jgi:importin subunit alpha-1
MKKAIWVIGNIAGESTAIRDKIIKMNCIEKIVFFLKTADRLQLVKNCLWALSNFCRGKQPPEYERVKQVVLY